MARTGRGLGQGRMMRLRPVVRLHQLGAWEQRSLLLERQVGLWNFRYEEVSQVPDSSKGEETPTAVSSLVCAAVDKRLFGSGLRGLFLGPTFCW